MEQDRDGCSIVVVHATCRNQHRPKVLHAGEARSGRPQACCKQIGRKREVAAANEDGGYDDEPHEVV
jgi:hypothetical protein